MKTVFFVVVPSMLYQSHADDPETPLEETPEAYAQLIREGKVRAIGASNDTADRLAQALQASESQGYPACQSLQPLFNSETCMSRCRFKAKNCSMTKRILNICVSLLPYRFCQSWWDPKKQGSRIQEIQ